MKDFLKDIGFFLKKFYDKSTNKFITVETNVKEVEHDVIRKILSYFQDKESYYIKEGTLILGFDLSKVIHVKNLEELIDKINDQYEKTFKNYADKYNLANHYTKNRYCYMYFSSYLTYYEAKNIFALLNLSREYLIEKNITTAILLSNSMMNIFLHISKDIFSWSQYNFNFSEEKSIDSKDINNFSFATINYSAKYYEQIEMLENNYLSAGMQNKILCAIDLFFLYNKTKNYTKLDDINTFIQNSYIIDNEVKEYLWILYYKDYKKSKQYIEKLLSKQEKLFELDYFSLKDFIFELKSSKVPNKIYINLLEIIDLKLRVDSEFLCASIFAKSLIYLCMDKDPKTVLKSFYDFIEIINECKNSNKELIESLFYIITIEAIYENNHEAIISLFENYKELLYKKIDDESIAQLLSSIFYLTAVSYIHLKFFNNAIILLNVSMSIKEKVSSYDTELIKIYFELSKIYYEQDNDEEKLREYIKKIHHTIEYINSNRELDGYILMHYISVVSGYIACGYNDDARKVLSYILKEINKNKKLNKDQYISLSLISLFFLTRIDVDNFENNYIKNSLELISEINNVFGKGTFIEGYQLKEAYVHILIALSIYFIKKEDSYNAYIMLKELYFFIVKHVDLKFLYLEKELSFVNKKSNNLKHSLKINKIIGKVNEYLSLDK